MVKFKNIMSCILITALMYIVSRCVPIFILGIFPGKLLIYYASMLLFLLAGWYIAGSISKWKHPKCLRTNLYIFVAIEAIGLIQVVTQLMTNLAMNTGRYSVDMNGIAYSDYPLVYGGTILAQALYIWLCCVLAGEAKNRAPKKD